MAAAFGVGGDFTQLLTRGKIMIVFAGRLEGALIGAAIGAVVGVVMWIVQKMKKKE